MKSIYRSVSRRTAKIFVFMKNLDKRCNQCFANGVFDNGCIVTDVTPEVIDVHFGVTSGVSFKKILIIQGVDFALV